MNVNILVQQFYEDLSIAFLGSHVEGTAFGSHQVKVDARLTQELVDVVLVSVVDGQVDGQLYGEPSVACALVDVDLHFEQFVKDIGSFVEDCVVDRSPAFFAQLIDDQRLHFLKFYELVLLDVLGEILEDVQELVIVFPLNFLEHFFAFLVEVLPDVELCLLLRIVFLVGLCLLFLANRVHGVLLLEPEDVVEISLIDVGVLGFLLALGLLQKLEVDFHSLANAVVGYRPPSDHAVVDLSLLDADDEMPAAVADPLLEVVE